MYKKIRSALISVYDKNGLNPILKLLYEYDVAIYSTGGTQKFIEQQGISVKSVESLTGYPAILGGRVKTLHPKVFGGILARENNPEDISTLSEYEIPLFDLVIVDLYPFERTLACQASAQEIIEKIDVGGIALIRAAAKNFNDTVIVASQDQYQTLRHLLEIRQGATSIADRNMLATHAFHVSSHYDTAIFQYFNATLPKEQHFKYYKTSHTQAKTLRYGENPHQQGIFYGDLNALFEQLNGKDLSYNNLLDIDAALALINDFPVEEKKAFAILKHNNACGMATARTCRKAYEKALQADPTSAFGGVLISNYIIDLATADLLHKLFFEVLIAPDFSTESLDLLKQKKNRILLKHKQADLPQVVYKTLLSGVIAQNKDNIAEKLADFQVVTKKKPSKHVLESLVFAVKLVKHAKSNAIVLAKDGQLFASGTGQTSRVDALKQAIHKAQLFGFDLSVAVMASDAFFPFPDCVQIAHDVGIMAVVQPGGSIKDKASIDYCDANGMVMVTTGVRHFRH